MSEATYGERSVAGGLLAWAFWRTHRLEQMCLAEGYADKGPGAPMHFSLWLSALCWC